MKKLLFLLAVLPLVAACDGKARKKSFTSATCVDGGGNAAQMRGYTRTVVAYGDSYLAVIPLSRIRPNTEFRFWLAPEPRSAKDPEYEAAWVSISGVDADTNVPAPWLAVSGQIAGGKALIACVPNLAPGEKYKYKVTISDKELTDPAAVIYGYIDPRADIIPW